MYKIPSRDIQQNNGYNKLLYASYGGELLFFNMYIGQNHIKAYFYTCKIH